MILAKQKAWPMFFSLNWNVLDIFWNKSNKYSNSSVVNDSSLFIFSISFIAFVSPLEPNKIFFSSAKELITKANESIWFRFSSMSLYRFLNCLDNS